MSPTPFTSTAPGRLTALLHAIVFTLIAAIAFFSGTWWRWLLVVPCLSLAGVMLASIPFPKLFLSGIRRDAGGFELRRPLHRPAFIAYGAITQIEAVVRNDQVWGPFIDLIVWTARQRVRLSEGMLFETGLLDELKNLPGFDAETYAIAKDFQPFGWSMVRPKRFLVLGQQPRLY